MSLFNLNKKDLGIDLGTANILVTIKGKGIVLQEPCVVAINSETREIVATGFTAKEMLGRTPKGIQAIKPLKDGVIADFTATQMMLKSIVSKICQRYSLVKPKVVVGVPSGITEVEERAVEEAILSAGAREVYTIEEPMVAAIGANLDVAEPTGNMIIDIGGGTTEVAVISLGGIVISNSSKTAGEEIDQDIINYFKRELNLAIGETTAEQIKKELACAMPLVSEQSMQVKGRDYQTGLPKEVTINSTQVEEAIKNSIKEIVDVVKQTLEKTPPELASDIVERGIILSGGGALIKNIDKLLSEKTGMPVYIVENPQECVVKGTEKTLEDLSKLKEVLLNGKLKK